ncbi:MAG: hypothetical protein RRB22_02645 [Gammaproteobacteria bacterium]|nr:hypothetical protein [Gammaproteobacteria bacterium]
MREIHLNNVGIPVLLPVLICLLFWSNASAEVAARDNGNDAALSRAQYLLREISMEKEALQAENVRLQDEMLKRDKKIESLNKKIELTKSSLSSSRDTLGKYQEAVTAQRARMGEMQSKFQKLVDKYKELVVALRLVESERADVLKVNQAGRRALENCADNNQQLYQVNMELLDQYKHKGVWDALLQKEPVTQLKQVEIENLLEEMQYRIEKLRVAENISASIGQ